MSQARKVLLISYFFPPDRTNESRRVQKVCKILLDGGCQVDVIHSSSNNASKDDQGRWNDMIPEQEKQGLLNVHKIEHLDTAKLSHYGVVGKILYRIFRLDWQWHYLLLLMVYLFKNRKNLKNYDYAYLTVRPYGLLCLPAFLKWIAPELKLISDYRFMFCLESYFYQGSNRYQYFYAPIDRLLFKSHLTNSDLRYGITTGVASILQKYCNQAVTGVDQGFDAREKVESEMVEPWKNPDKINLVYIGNVAPGASDPQMLANFCKNLIQAYPEIEVHMFGKLDIMKKYIANDNQIKLHGYLKSTQIGSVLKQADLLLVFYTDDGQSDYRVGTKTFDYMQAAKPVLAHCSKDSGTYEVLSSYPAFLWCDSKTDLGSRPWDLDQESKKEIVVPPDYEIHTLYRKYFLNPCFD